MDAQTLLARPIIIVGAPRSGTTLLGQVLKHHPALAYAEEHRMVWRFGNDRRSDLLTPTHARPEVIRHIRDHYARHVADAARQRLLEKNPSNALRLPFVDRVFPDARYVHILRNGYDSVLSIDKFWDQHAAGLKMNKVRSRWREINWRRAPHYVREVLRRTAPRSLRGVVGQPVWGPRLPAMDALLQELQRLEVCALQWTWCVNLALSFGRRLPPERYFECRLEDLDRSTLDRILAFCQLEPSAEVDQQFVQTFQPDKAGARKKVADSAQLELIRPWIEQTMLQLGYPLDAQ